MTPILDQPLDVIAAALQEGGTTAEELTTRAIERHEAVGLQLKAYQTWDPEKALAEARAAD
ncbi:MAG: amidase, partial [Acidimicrobiia bacterium]